MLFERLGWEKARKAVGKVMVGAVIFGVMLSTLHQSSLGAVFLIAPEKMSPLWWGHQTSLSLSGFSRGHGACHGQFRNHAQCQIS